MQRVVVTTAVERFNVTALWGLDEREPVSVVQSWYGNDYLQRRATSEPSGAPLRHCDAASGVAANTKNCNQFRSQQ